MMSVEKTIARFIEQHQLLSQDELALVAVSGGADSVCLLLLLQQMGYRVEAVHCNFKLRAKESDRDEQFVIELCNKHNIPLHITHFDTKTYAETHKVSIEMAARQLRYHYFEQLRKDIGAAAVCVAHHREDSVETILMNLIRGTGIHGLTGIKPRNGHIVRPLLCVSRTDIELWLAQRQQLYVTDSTNLTADVVRNKLRLNVVPQLLDVTPAAMDNILLTAQRLEETARVADNTLKEQLEKLKTDDSINIRQLQQMPSSEALLFEWLSPYSFASAVIEAIAQRIATAQTGRQWFSATHQLTVHHGRLLLSPRQEPFPALCMPEAGCYLYNNEQERMKIEVKEGRYIMRQSNAASLDADKVRFPLTLRTAKPADRFHPFGMKGSKLVSDYLTDRHIPLPQKHRQQVMTDADGHIVWLVDQRPDDDYCVKEYTRWTLIISHEQELRKS